MIARKLRTVIILLQNPLGFIPLGIVCLILDGVWSDDFDSSGRFESWFKCNGCLCICRITPIENGWVVISGRFCPQATKISFWLKEYDLLVVLGFVISVHYLAILIDVHQSFLLLFISYLQLSKHIYLIIYLIYVFAAWSESNKEDRGVIQKEETETSFFFLEDLLNINEP